MTAPQTESLPAPPRSKRGGARPNTGGRREGSGRKQFVPTDAERVLVETLAIGLPVDQIRVLVRNGIGNDTLEKYFRDELQRGRAKANAKIAQCLFQKALKGDTACLIFWAKTRMGWKDTSVHEITGKGGAPIRFDVSGLSISALREILDAKAAMKNESETDLAFSG